MKFDPLRPQEVVVSTSAHERRWSVGSAEVRGVAVRLSGMTDRLPSVTDDRYWFVLMLAEVSEIDHWANRVPHRRDRA